MTKKVNKNIDSDKKLKDIINRAKAQNRLLNKLLEEIENQDPLKKDTKLNSLNN